MITTISLTLALSVPLPLPFPCQTAAFGHFLLDDLARMDLSIVRPLGSPYGEKRSGMLMIIQRFSVLNSRNPETKIVEVRLPNRNPYEPPRLIMGQKPRVVSFAPPPERSYLLLSEKPESGTLPEEFRPRRPDMIDDMPRLDAKLNERLGLALIETPLARLPQGGSGLGDALRALALSSGVPSEWMYSALPVWEWLLPTTAASWSGVAPGERSKRDVIEGMPILDFLRERITPLIPRRTTQASDMHSAQYWALQAKWGVPGALSALADRLEGLVRTKNEMVFSFPFDALGLALPSGSFLRRRPGRLEENQAGLGHRRNPLSS